MPIIAMSIRLQAIRMFLERALLVHDEYTQRFLSGPNSDSLEDDAEYENAGDVLLDYQDIVVRAALGELNALVEHELKHLAIQVQGRSRFDSASYRQMDRGKASGIVESQFSIKLSELPGSADIEAIRHTVNAYKHNEGLRRDQRFSVERYVLDWDEALRYVDSVRAFLRALPGVRDQWG